MNAAEKMHAYGIEPLADQVGRHVSVVYRWRKALLAGEGIRDANKRKLMAATAGSVHAISWSDFAPKLEEAA